ncbi:isocitrate lyase/phosphoenolpyruvate mutase family protein [Pseudonocardiaceae bacterium YIM PH 21723]|nr:isocitrate lyase/phosphoenolpyruvate mutase family protein [Pseudonocardiaceae bacterium YIM PH 21723]
MSDQYERFLALHQQDRPFIMPNPFDGLSAALFADAGFQAIGTSSAALAFSLGRPDGRHAVSREEHIAHAQLLARSSGLPVNGDFEDGYGDTPEEVAGTVRAAIDAGLAGIGIEDTSADPENPIRDFAEAVARVRAAVEVGRGKIVITGRTDNFIQGRADLDDTIRRLTAFAEAGADVLYAPYPPDVESIAAIVKAVAPKPVNVVGTSVSLDELTRVGVKRISLGAVPYLHVVSAVRTQAERLAKGDFTAFPDLLPYGDATSLVTR